MEIVELIQCIIATGSVKGYFESIWNYVDVLSITLFCVSIAMWGAMVTQFRKFNTLHRYDVYLNNNQAARLLELKAGGAAMQDFVSVVNDFNDIMANQVVGYTSTVHSALHSSAHPALSLDTGIEGASLTLTPNI